MEGLQGMTPAQQQDFMQHLESQQVSLECSTPKSLLHWGAASVVDPWHSRSPTPFAHRGKHCRQTCNAPLLQ